jgi:hypothetical protein
MPDEFARSTFEPFLVGDSLDANARHCLDDIRLGRISTIQNCNMADTR